MRLNRVGYKFKMGVSYPRNFQMDVNPIAKILFLDIETAPNLGYTWGKFEQNVLAFERPWYMLSYAYKWYGEDRAYVVALPDFEEYKKDRENDAPLVASLRWLLDEADIVIAHNGDSFDLVKINTRMLKHGMAPPKPYKTVDTLKIARKVFAFDSNKLDDLCHYLGIGRKLPHTGFHLWKSVMDGDMDAWKTMKAYNLHDVELLEGLYNKLRAWAPNHPTVNIDRTVNTNCPTCGTDHVQRRGFSYTALSKKQRFKCMRATCGRWYEGSAKRI